jgi:hypothetical protein
MILLALAVQVDADTVVRTGKNASDMTQFGDGLHPFSRSLDLFH